MRNGIGKRLTALLLSGMMILTNSSGVVWAGSMEMQVEEADIIDEADSMEAELYGEDETTIVEIQEEEDLYNTEDENVVESNVQELTDDELIEDMMTVQEDDSETVEEETEFTDVFIEEETEVVSDLFAETDSVPDATEWCGHYYKAIETKMTVSEASAYCKSQGGYLATVTSTPEFDFLCDLLNSKSDRSDIYLMNYGEGSDDGPFYWNTGEESEFYYWFGGGNFSRSSYIAIEWHKANTNYGAGWGIAGVATEDTGTYSFICEWGERIDISEAEITLSSTAFTFNGRAYIPDITVKYAGLTLEENCDYYYEISNNIFPGNAQLKIYGMGRFWNSQATTFEILENVNVSEEAYPDRLVNDCIIPSGAEEWCGHYYKRIETKMTVSEAVAYCESQGGIWPL